MIEWLLLALSLLLMVACGIFVAAEFSFVTVDRATVDRAAADGAPGAAGTQQALRTLSTQLSGAQLGITITNLAIGFLAEPALGTLLRGPFEGLGMSDGGARAASYLVALVLSTAVTMLVGELVPKNIALALPMATARFTQLPQRVFTAVMAWPIRRLNGTANAILRSWGIEPQEELRSARSPVELRSLVLRSAAEGAIDDQTANLVARSIAFGDRTAADVRTPRVRVTFLEGRDSADAVIEAARATGHSRFPVIGRTPDEVLGIVHVKHAVRVPVDRRRSTRIEDIAAPAATVPDTLELDPLLAQLREQNMQMAVVIDEYGGTDGVVTLEDLVEEIVGDIADEHDRVAQHSRHRQDGTWSLSGLLRPDEVLEETGIALPEGDDYETIAGLVVAELGRLAQRGDTVSFELTTPAEDDGDDAVRVDVLLRVDRVEGRRIDRITLTAAPATSGGER